MDAGRYRELEVLKRLRDYLSSGFEDFHNIALLTIRGGRDRYGEIDVAALSPGGCLLLMEVKASPVISADRCECVVLANIDGQVRSLMKT